MVLGPGKYDERRSSQSSSDLSRRVNALRPAVVAVYQRVERPGRRTEATDAIPLTDGGGSAGATNTLSQPAHRPVVDDMDDDHRRRASTVGDGGNHFHGSDDDVCGGDEPAGGRRRGFDPKNVVGVLFPRFH